MIFRNFYLNSLASSNLIPRKIRYILYKIYGLNIKTSSICSNCFIGGKNIKIDKEVFINYQCFFDTSAKIIIENKCKIGFQTTFITSNHLIGSSENRGGERLSKPIRVESGCWIGARVTILPGVTIGRGCIIGAGSVVTKDCEPNGVYAGNPAKRIKDL